MTKNNETANELCTPAKCSANGQVQEKDFFPEDCNELWAHQDLLEN